MADGVGGKGDESTMMREGEGRASYSVGPREELIQGVRRKQNFDTVRPAYDPYDQAAKAPGGAEVLAYCTVCARATTLSRFGRARPQQTRPRSPRLIGLIAPRRRRASS